MTTSWNENNVCADCGVGISDQARKCKPCAKPRKRAVTDGDKVFGSVMEAADRYGVTSAAVVYRCKSGSRKWVAWMYVDEDENGDVAVMADDEHFDTLGECAKHFGITRQALNYRIKSESAAYKNWFLVDEAGNEVSDDG